MKKPTIPAEKALTEEQKELVSEMISLLVAANKMPFVLAWLENLAERRANSLAMRDFVAARFAPGDPLTGVNPAVIAQNSEYRRWLTKALRERAAVIKPGMSPVMNERELLDAEIPF